MGQGAARLRQLVAGRRAPARHPRRARRLQGRQHLRVPDRAERGLVRRRAVHGGALPRPGRQPSRRGLHASQPRPRAHVSPDRPRRPECLLPRRDRRGDRGCCPAPADRRRRQPPLAAGPDHAGRPRELRGARACADPHRLPRPGRVGHRPAVERRLDGGRGAQHPRGLLGPRRQPHARAPPDARVLALHVRGPQRLPRRSGLLRRPARGPPLGQLRRRAPRPDPRAPRRHEPRGAGRSPRQPGRLRERRPGQRDDQPPAPVHDPPRGVGSPGERRLLHVHHRVHRRQRDRRARLRLPAEQRADRLQLRLAHAPEPRSRAASARAAR